MGQRLRRILVKRAVDGSALRGIGGFWKMRFKLQGLEVRTAIIAVAAIWLLAIADDDDAVWIGAAGDDGRGQVPGASYLS